MQATPRSDLAPASRPAYEPPRLTVMDETEVLRAFQFTSASYSWWTV
jgi:hypothetical protein